MNTHVKRGEVYLQHQKHFEKWKRYWLSIYPDSGHGVARLELIETGSDKSPVLGRRHPERKVIRIADCISVVRLPPHAEAYPADNMAAFCVDTSEKMRVFAVEKEDCGEWVDKICEIAFQKSKSNAPQPAPVMEKNEIYSSREEVFEFQVTVLQSDVLEHCNLQGSYWLLVGEEKLVLKNVESRQKVMEWPYKLLRRYGCDKTTLSIEAGRRCESGPGTIQFDTQQGEQILRLMELAIQQQKNLTVSGGNTTLFSPFSPLPKVPSIDSLLDVISSDSGMSPSVYSFGSEDNKPPVVSSKSTQRYSAESICLPEVGFVECVYSQPADAIRSQQTDNTRPRQYKDIEPVYSDPVDIIHRTSNPQTHVSHATETTHCGSQPEPVYAEVLYVVPQSGQKKEEETIYSLPDIGKVCKPRNADESSPAVDEVIYSQVNKARKPIKPQDESTANIKRIMSEDLGLI
ncbi:docking protein 2 [Trichomycterus rosablanca]|uniref:docking protein 2 n=1 Tax=Trichomycterus rosablanca TaxID=2290929 RepID=UPI002F3589A0